MSSEDVQISAVIIAYNEARKIEPCLQSVMWADEVVVVDLGSTDSTVDICRKYAAKIVQHGWEPFADPVRNYAASLARGQWVLNIDADEYVSHELAMSIQRLVREDWPCDVVTVEMRTVRFGRVLDQSEADVPGRTPRLFRKGSVDWPSAVHCTPDLEGLRVRHLPGAEYGVIEHNAWTFVDDVIGRIGRYTKSEAIRRYDAGERYSTLRAMYSSSKEFIDILLLRRSYRDGVPGLFFALAMGMYRLFVWMQLWEHQGRPSGDDLTVRRTGAIVSFPFRLAFHGFRSIEVALSRIAAWAGPHLGTRRSDD